MSSTVVINPTSTTNSEAVGTALIPLALIGAGLWAAVRAVAAQDEECAKLLAKSREELRRERLAVVELRSSDLTRLTRVARDARFLANTLPSDSVRLTAGTGLHVWATRTPSGINLMGGEATIRQLLIANTASRALEHLKSRGFQVSVTGWSKSSEVTLVGKAAGTQSVEMNIGSSGEACVDLKGFRGKECEGVVRDLAAALEGTVTKFCPKPEYYGGVTIQLGGKQRA